MTATDANIILVGPPGAGKTSAGQALAALVSWEFRDTDDLIELKAGARVPEIFSQHGEAAFRQMERELLEELRDRNLTRHIFATGGGILTTEGNLSRLEAIGRVVCLRADAKIIARRLEGDKSRPLLQGESGLLARIESLMTERAPLYDAVPTQICTDIMSADEIAVEIRRLFPLA